MPCDRLGSSLPLGTGFCCYLLLGHFNSSTGRSLGLLDGDRGLLSAWMSLPKELFFRSPRPLDDDGPLPGTVFFFFFSLSPSQVLARGPGKGDHSRSFRSFVPPLFRHIALPLSDFFRPRPWPMNSAPHGSTSSPGFSARPPSNAGPYGEPKPSIFLASIAGLFTDLRTPSVISLRPLSSSCR